MTKSGPNVLIDLEEIGRGTNSTKYIGTGSSPDFGSYSYTAWGDWNGDGRKKTNDGRTTVDHGHWLLGAMTPTQDMPKSGSATYNGDLRGDWISSGIGSTSGTIEKNVISGSVNMNANFNSGKLSGNMDLKRKGNSWAQTQFNNISINGNSYNGNMSVTGGGNGGLYGNFFGPKAEETGGGFFVDKQSGDHGGASGVFRAKK